MSQTSAPLQSQTSALVKCRCMDLWMLERVKCEEK